MKQILRILAILASGGTACAAAVVFGGLYNVSARQGHLPGVSRVLHTSFRSAVTLRAPPPSDVPPLTEDMAALGARHFDTGCRTCHGAPGETRMAAARAMVPAPPHIAEAVRPWTPAELFWIVREGVKMTGMPAFPAPRDDEVWAVVAFLEQARDMSQVDYKALTARPAANADLAYCATCHGREGRSANDLVPRLDILSEPYLASALKAYREGRRQSGIMQQAASLVSPETLDDLAAYFGSRSLAERQGEPVDANLAKTGSVLAASGSDDIPACRACHGPEAERDNPLFPALAGQSQPYLATQLRLWRDGHGTSGPRGALMHRAAAELGDDDIAALAAYYASLPVD